MRGNRERVRIFHRHMNTPESEAPRDPFRLPRQDSGLLPCRIQGETIPMILRHADVRDAAKNWQTFSSDTPFRVPIPSEEDVRSVRQLPIETDPPQHAEYRKIVDPFFKRPKQPEFVEQIRLLIGELLEVAIEQDSLEVVHEFAIPLQSRALAHLLGVPQSEAEIWISWGTHVFKEGAGEKKGAALEEYIHSQLDRAARDPGDDFFSALVKARFENRPLNREEMVGFANLTFAGGRDTVIHTVSSVIAHLAANPDILRYLREDPKRVVLAGEEYLRVFVPLTHIGRTCPAKTDLHGQTVEAGGRVSLCWASANRDASVFPDPDSIQLARKPNPHLAFGSGAHLCLGALHMRLLLRTLLEELSKRVECIHLQGQEKLIEEEEAFHRAIGYNALTVTMTGSPKE